MSSIFPLTDRLRNSRKYCPYTAGDHLDMSPILPPVLLRYSLGIPSMFLRLNSAQKPVFRDTKMQLHRQKNALKCNFSAEKFAYVHFFLYLCAQIGKYGINFGNRKLTE